MTAPNLPDDLNRQWADAFNAGDLAAFWPCTSPTRSWCPDCAEVLRRQDDGTWKYVIDHPFGGAD